jgi:exonuclease SbcC
MKPLILELQAFGPFAHRQVIDFRLLGSKTFFLIHGPTGSGKTTILDGMCFALFGDSSGGERDGRQMRSHHAGLDTLTEVRFDFALGTDRYRVRRVPEQMRRALRGGGETVQNPKADLWRIVSEAGGEKEAPVASGWADVTRKIVELLGFDSRQFRQVIMLPQGKFREFLMANSQERESILQTLFGTELYKRIEDSLKNAANALARDSETVRTQRQTLLDQANAASEADLEARLQGQKDELARCQGEERKAAAAASQAEKALAEARGVAARFAELDAATQGLLSLANEQPAWLEKRKQLGLAHQAASTVPYEAAMLEAAQLLSAEQTQTGKLLKVVEAAGKVKTDADALLATANASAPEIDKTIGRLAELDALATKVAALGELRTQHAAAVESEALAGRALAEAQDKLKSANLAIASLTELVQRTEVLAAAHAGHKASAERSSLAVDQLGALAKARTQLKADQATLALQEAVLKAAEALLLSSRKDLEGTRQGWIAGQAARLALALTEGQACPVCGATEHPAPAHGTEELISDDALKAVEDRVQAAEKTFQDAEKKLAQVQDTIRAGAERIADLERALGPTDGRPEAELIAERDKALTTAREADQAAQAVPGLKEKLALDRLSFEKLEGSVSLHLAAAQKAQASLQQIAGQRQEREAGIPPELAEAKALQSAREVADNRIKQLRSQIENASQAAQEAAKRLGESNAQLGSSREHGKTLDKQLKKKTEEFSARLQAAGFADTAAYQAAKLSNADATRLDEAIRNNDAALKAAEERLRRATSDSATLTRPAIDKFAEDHESAKTALLAASGIVQQLLVTLQGTTGFVASLTDLAKRFRDIEDRYAVIKRVSDVANGNNPQRMSFQRYVLATLLEEVLAATTTRLRIMSRGRYEMRRKIEPVNQRAAAGLDLEIFDHYTGTARAAGTLSGGESFLASLALALGLSDVVQSYAGGIRLDAIFVDEGFGTLDPESLDFAIRALKDLQQAGRLVGIISHVTELKEWIDARLVLSATQGGSEAAFVGVQ